jgi:hypothetical protein
MAGAPVALRTRGRRRHDGRIVLGAKRRVVAVERPRVLAAKRCVVAVERRRVLARSACLQSTSAGPSMHFSSRRRPSLRPRRLPLRAMQRRGIHGLRRGCELASVRRFLQCVFAVPIHRGTDLSERHQDQGHEGDDVKPMGGARGVGEGVPEGKGHRSFAFDEGGLGRFPARVRPEVTVRISSDALLSSVRRSGSSRPGIETWTVRRVGVGRPYCGDGQSKPTLVVSKMRRSLLLLAVVTTCFGLAAAAKDHRRECSLSIRAYDQRCRVTQCTLYYPLDGGSWSSETYDKWWMPCGTARDECGKSIVCECPVSAGAPTRGAIFRWSSTTDAGTAACSQDFVRTEDAGHFSTTRGGETFECLPHVVQSDSFTADGGARN